MGLKSPHTLPHGLVPTNNSHMGRLGASRQFYSPLTLVVQVVPRDLGHLLSLEGLPDPVESGARDIEASFSSSQGWVPPRKAQSLPPHLVPNSGVRWWSSPQCYPQPSYPLSNRPWLACLSSRSCLTRKPNNTRSTGSTRGAQVSLKQIKRESGHRRTSQVRPQNSSSHLRSL